MGRGEFQGAFNNMRAVAVAIAPISTVDATHGCLNLSYTRRVWLLVALIAGVIPAAFTVQFGDMSTSFVIKRELVFGFQCLWCILGIRSETTDPY